MHDAKRIVSPTPFLNNSERCLADRQSRHDQILAIMLRSPLKHVLSQFLHCKYAPIHLDRTAFPSGPGLYGGFEEWITHFLQLRDRQQTMATSTSITQKAKQAFSCYNPWNMQTRYLTSKEKDRASECFRKLCPCHLASVSEFNPDIDLGKHAIQHLVNFVGIADLYVESLCLLHFSSHGSVPQSCACGGVGPLTSTTNNTHMVPHHDIGDLPQDLLKKASSLVQQDVQLFAYALKRFEQELRSASKSTGVQMVCEDRLRKLWDQIAGTTL